MSVATVSVPVKELVVSEGTIRPPLRDRSSLDRFTEQLVNGGAGESAIFQALKVSTYLRSHAEVVGSTPAMGSWIQQPSPMPS